MQVKSHIEETKLLYELNQRVKQRSHCNNLKVMKVDTIDVWLFSFNSMELTWVLQLSQLLVRLLNWIIMLDVSYQNIMKLAYLLESSTVVPIENIFPIFPSALNSWTKNDLLKLLLYNATIYLLSLLSKERVHCKLPWNYLQWSYW